MKTVLTTLLCLVALTIPVATQEGGVTRGDRVMLAAQAVDETTSAGFPVNENVAIVLFVETNGTVSSGQVILEEANSSDYSGTWSIVATVNPTVSNAVTAVHQRGAWRSLRVRINTVIGGGGTITATLVGRPE